jgi:hypothetical protein
MSATTSTIRLVRSQKELLASITPALLAKPRTTAALRRARGDHHAYDSFLRDRLSCLASKGLLQSTWTGRGRFWNLTEARTPWHAVSPATFALLHAGFRSALEETPRDLVTWGIAFDWLTENPPAGRAVGWEERIADLRADVARVFGGMP